jgi:hypothetical protein
VATRPIWFIAERAGPHLVSKFAKPWIAKREPVRIAIGSIHADLVQTSNPGLPCDAGNNRGVVANIGETFDTKAKATTRN